MRFFILIVGVLVVVVQLSACAGGPTEESAAHGATAVVVAGSGDLPQPKPGTVLIFHENEPDNDAHRVVVFVNPDVMRINDWREVGDYILFDRTTQTIYNVVKKDETVLVIKKRPVTVKPPLAYEVVEQKEKSAAAGSTSGNDAFHYKYMIKDRVCYNAVSLDGYLPDAVAGMIEFRTVLAGEHTKTIGSTPVEMLDACDLAMNIFEPGRYLEKGFPIREWDSKGYQRFLVDVRNNIVTDPQLLALPAGYTHYEIGGAAGPAK